MASELDVSLDELLFLGRGPRPSAEHARRVPTARPRGRTRSPRDPVQRAARPQVDPARVGRRLGAADHRVDPERRLPVRDLRGRRRVEPGARVPAPRRPGVGLRPQRHAPGHDRLRRVRPRAGRRDRARLDDPASARQRGRRAGPRGLVRARAAAGDVGRRRATAAAGVDCARSRRDCTLARTTASPGGADALRRPRRLVVRRRPDAASDAIATASPRQVARRARAGRRPHRARGRRASRRAAGSQRHVHSFEEALYVLAGELALEIDGRVHHLVAGDFALIPLGVRHALGNAATSRSAGCRSTRRSGSRRTPAGRTRSSSAQPFDAAALVARAERPPFGDPSLRFVGHYDGHAAPGRGAPARRPGARPPAGRDGHRAPRRTAGSR